MTDSTIDNKPGEGGFDVGSSAEELFGGIDEESPETGVDRNGETESADDAPTEDDETSDIEDQTAASVFGQLKDDVDSDGSDEVLADESPDDIIASADEPDPDREPIHEDLRPDDDELTDLLLTGRTKDQEFLWIDTDEEQSETPTEGDVEIGDEATATDVETGDKTDDGTRTDDLEQPPTDATSEPATAAIESAASAETEPPSPATTGSEPADTLAETSDSTAAEMPAESATDTLETDADTADELDAHGSLDDRSGGDSELPESTEPAATPDDDGATDGQALEVHESETADVPASTDESEDDDSPGFVRRLLSKLNPF